jgi:hypothetical protein
MKKWITVAICIVCAIVLMISSLSSKKGDVYTSIGSTYNKFLFIPAKSAHFTISFKSPYTGSLTLIDEKGNSLSNSKYTISVDGQKKGANFSVKNKKRVHVTIRCSKTVSPGKQYIRVKGGGPLVTHVYFKHHLNPLLAYLSWIITLVSVVILIWFVLLQKLIYPTFKTYKKNILIEKSSRIISQTKVDFTGARKVIFSNKREKQSVLNKFFCGKIITLVNAKFESPISFNPTRNRKAANTVGKAYIITPNPIQRSGIATIINQQKQLKITLN